MIIAVASGKGGTGKTTMATNLAWSAGEEVQLLDCDVEEPNCHIFLRPTVEETIPVSIVVPEVDKERCTGCGKCGEMCQFNAIAALKTEPLIFPELCHGCKGCILICPEQALTEGRREVGVLERGRSAQVGFVQGRLRIGEAMAPPLIRAVKRHIQNEQDTIIDAPPGTSCPVIEAVKGSDFVLLVTEPTPFGLNDLKLAVELVRQLGLDFGVLINRSDIGDDRVREYCRGENIEVLLEIPDDRRIAQEYSRGALIVEAICGLGEKFEGLWARLKEKKLKTAG